MKVEAQKNVVIAEEEKPKAVKLQMSKQMESSKPTKGKKNHTQPALKPFTQKNCQGQTQNILNI